MMTDLTIKKGMQIRCLYPQHGKRNVLCLQTGIVERAQISKNGVSFTIRNPTTGKCRTLLTSKMVNTQVVN